MTELNNLTMDTGDLLIVNANLINGASNSIQKRQSILIKDGRIIEIGEEILAKNIPQLNADGAYVLPGLIDSHVHLMWGPGAAIQNIEPPNEQNWEEGWGKYFSHYLKAYLACGVTTVLDACAFPFVVNTIRKYLLDGNPGPRVLHLGPFISTPGGYGCDFEHTAQTPEDVEEQLEKIFALNSLGVKIPVERGWSTIGGSYPMHSSDILQAIKQGADKCKMPIYVHATSEEDQITALKLGVHALAHTLSMRSEKLSEEFIELMKQTQTYQMCTLQTMDSNLTYYYTERLNDPLLEIVAPEQELTAARDAKIRQLALAMSAEYGDSRPPSHDSFHSKLRQKFPFTYTMLFSALVKLFNSKKKQAISLENSKDAISRLHQAGVPIVMGSDTAHTPSAIYAFHGFNSLREIELLGKAGLTCEQAIKAATVTPAKMLGLSNEIGTIEIGKYGDLVIVRDNPLENLQALRSIQFTVKDGVARTPTEWMNL